MYYSPPNIKVPAPAAAQAPVTVPGKFNKDDWYAIKDGNGNVINWAHGSIHGARMAKEDFNRQSGLQSDGAPVRPTYTSLLDPATGLLKKEYTMDMGMLDASKLEGYQAMREQAMRKGPSAWAQLMREQQNQQRMQGMEKAANQAASGAAMARSGLSMRGGMNSGARERIAKQSMLDMMGARQNVGRTNTESLLKIDTQDETNRQGAVGQFAGMETDLNKYNIGNAAKVKEFNIMRALEEKTKGDTQELEVYKKQLEKWGAERQAEATSASEGGGK